MTLSISDLKLQKRWVLWRYEEAGGKPTKVPYQRNGARASSTNNATWATWEELQPFFPHNSGVGIMLGEPLSGADLDDCFDGDRLLPWAEEIVRRLDSYTERSPSGKGVRILTLGRHGGATGKKRKLSETGEGAEVYDNARFLTFTGNHLAGTPTDIHERADALAWLWASIAEGKYPPAPESLSVKVSRANFDKLQAGDWSAYGSQSDAVAAFVYLLCRKYSNDDDVDTAFRESGMFSEKWADGKWDRLGAEEIKRARQFLKEHEPLPRLTHGSLAEGFLRDNSDFLSLYDSAQIAQWVGTRWDLSPANDERLLFRAVGKYLGQLWARYPAPEAGKSDPRRTLEDANTVQGVVRMVKANLQPALSDRFDHDPNLLGLPSGRVVDLRTSAIRDMRREDYITQRVYVAPDANCPTPVWDRFRSEISCGDAALADYLVRIGALCLTALPWQKLFFFTGSGRNGKGVFIRTLCKILGTMTWALRPEQVTAGRYDDSKRMLSNFKGKRLVTCNESVGGNLNLALLKVISGGDELTGARMRQDEIKFRPTHKVILPTNDVPQLPADPAFLGRVVKVPFRASFVGREDVKLEDKLSRELPGILHKLIQAAPDVVANGLREPAVVLEDTTEYFRERDIARQFIDDCIEADAGGKVRVSDMEDKVREWLGGQRRAGIVVSVDGNDTQYSEVLKALAVRFPKKRMRDESAGRTEQGNAQIRWFTGCNLSSR